MGPGILHNDTVPCGSAVQVEVITPPKHGKVEFISDDGSFTYVQVPSGDTNTRQRNRQHSRQARAASPVPLLPDSFTYEIMCPDTGLVSPFDISRVLLVKHPSVIHFIFTTALSCDVLSPGTLTSGLAQPSFKHSSAPCSHNG